MNLAIAHSRAAAGIQAPAVIIEVHLSKGLPGFSIVGLPETAVKESRHRVRSAIINSGFEFPVRRITVNLAPADLPKEGGRFDLPIALGILAASLQIPKEILQAYEIIGELALSGEVRACEGIVPLAIATRAAGRHLILPSANIEESLLVSGLTVFGASDLISVCAHLTGAAPLAAAVFSKLPSPLCANFLDLEQVQGQAHARRALEIAAAGGHSLLMVGPPGSGKTMLASRLSSILPPMTESEALEVATIYSISRSGFDFRNWQQRPFRGPHHTASNVALVGGGNPPRPGEVSLAHQGVLFLDELPEFSRPALEALREPLESGCVHISRANNQTVFPSGFQLIAAMNPCPCGYQGDRKDRCRCSAEQIQRYQHKISGPLLDRIDMHLTVHALPPSLLIHEVSGDNETSATVRERVSRVRAIQENRQKKINAVLIGDEISNYCHLDSDNQRLLAQLIDALGLSARAYHRILRLARTIADMNEAPEIMYSHLQEAISYRRTQIMP